jgi:hypothetical protein
MSIQRGGFLNSKFDFGNIDIIRDPMDAPHSNYSPVDEESARIARAYDRNTSALLMQRFRERARADELEGVFRLAIRALELSPAQITAAVEAIFAPYAEKAAVERAAAEEAAEIERVAAEQQAERDRIRSAAVEAEERAAQVRLDLDAAERDAAEASRVAELLQIPEPDVVEEEVRAAASEEGG